MRVALLALVAAAAAVRAAPLGMEIRAAMARTWAVMAAAAVAVVMVGRLVRTRGHRLGPTAVTITSALGAGQAAPVVTTVRRARAVAAVAVRAVVRARGPPR